MGADREPEPDAAQVHRARLDLFSWDDRHLVIGGVRAARIAERAGTPTFVTDGDAVLAAVARIRQAFGPPAPHLLYPVKAYANIRLLRDLRAVGLGVDVCSPGDLAFARAAGFTDTEISFLGHGIAPAEVEAIAAEDILFTADSLGQLERYSRSVESGRPVGLRVNPALGIDRHEHVVAGAASSKFGLPLAELTTAVELALECGLRPVSLHVHLGSDLLHADDHLAALEQLVERAAEIPTLERVNLGGGYGVPFTTDEPRFPWHDFASRAAALLADSGLDLYLEPGTALVREAGYLLVRVTDVMVRDGRTVVATDGNTNALLGRLLYGTQHPVTPAILRGRTEADAPRRTDRLATITGNLMLGGDVLTTVAELPAPEIGDVLVFALVGAYGAARTSTFNNRPQPAEVYVRADEARLVRARPSAAELLVGQLDVPLSPR